MLIIVVTDHCEFLFPECSSNCFGLHMCTSSFAGSCCNFLAPSGDCRRSCPENSNSTDDFDCDCLPGFSGGDCSTDIDECSSNPCLNNGNCTDGINSFSCECGEGYTGVNCSVSMEQCDILCQNGGTCILDEGIPTCQCTRGFTGNLCQGIPSLSSP